jgi:succinate dehydrogenase/fumarate reductase flavoprotein subunit
MSGDAMAMAFRAGAAIIDPEFVQFQRVAIWPPRATHSALGLLQFLRGIDIWWNSEGKQFTECLGIERSRKDFTDQEVEKIATMKEILAGRTGEHGGVFSSIHHIPSNLIDLMGKEGRFKNWTSPSGHDFKPVISEMKKGLAIETSLGAHYFLGGIKINGNCESTIPGVFAAGECVGGILGSKRTAGTAIASCMTLGARAGGFAAAHARGKEHEPIPMDSVRESRKRIFDPLQRSEGANPFQMRERLQHLAFFKVGVVRTQTGLQEAIQEIEEIKRTDAATLHVKTKETVYNLEWVEAIETLNILQCLEIIARAALVRNESRGTHYRDDYPYEDNDGWLKNVIVTKDGDKMQLTTSSIQLGKFKGKIPTGQHQHFPPTKTPTPIRPATSR